MFVLLIGFFFFKQKTAYEVRISDWSSDVCSSDLASQRLWPMSRRDCRWVMSIPSVWCELRGSAGRRLAAGPWSELLQVEGGQFADVVDGQVRRQIGRASCRDRVCQYV